MNQLRAGARGFVLKIARPKVQKNALDPLLLTGKYYTDASHDVLTRHPAKKTREERERDKVVGSITARAGVHVAGKRHQRTRVRADRNKHGCAPPHGG